MIVLKTSDKPIASILILSLDNLEQLGDCLESLAYSINAEDLPYEVIVLFQQMCRDQVRSFMSGIEGVRELHARLNLGFGGGNNLAARHARGKYLVFLNDDTLTQPHWLEWLVSTAESREEVGAVGSRILFPDGTLQEAGVIVWADGSCYPLGRGDAPGSLRYSYVRPVDYVSANGLLVSQGTFHEVGGFDARFFPGYYEDVDLCLTIRHTLGKKILYEPRSVILHHESVTMKRDPEFRSFLFRRHQAAFRSKWRHVLSSYPSPEPESRVAVERAVLRPSGNAVRVLVIDDRLPRAGMGAGAGRIADLFHDLSWSGFAVAMCPTDRGRLPTENLFAGLGVNLIMKPLREHLEEAGIHYDVVIISRPHNFLACYATIREALPETPIVYDVEALYHRRLQLQASLCVDVASRGALEAEAASMLELETKIARSVDHLVAISENELAWLEQVDGHAPAELMRPLSRGIEMSVPHLESRSQSIFVASWLAGENSPNVDALRWYAQEVLPRVRARRPNFVTYVTGGNPPLNVQVISGRGIVLLGFVESIDDLYRSARTAIVPILAGAGVKIKTIEALQYGVPVVATNVGAEGLGLDDGEEIDIADDPCEYANRLIALDSNDQSWLDRREKLAARIMQWERERIDWQDVVARALSGGKVATGGPVVSQGATKRRTKARTVAGEAC